MFTHAHILFKLAHKIEFYFMLDNIVCVTVCVCVCLVTKASWQALDELEAFCEICLLSIPANVSRVLCVCFFYFHFC